MKPKKSAKNTKSTKTSKTNKAPKKVPVELTDSEKDALIEEGLI